MTIISDTGLLHESIRERVAELADVLMPAGLDLPAPSEIDIQGHWLDLAVAAAPRMARSILAATDGTAKPEDAIAKLEAEQPEVFTEFAFFISGAYFMHPRVRQALGYEGQSIPEDPPAEGESEYYLEGDLLQPVLARGPIYRKPPAPAD